MVIISFMDNINFSSMQTTHIPTCHRSQDSRAEVLCLQWHVTKHHRYNGLQLGPQSGKMQLHWHLYQHTLHTQPPENGALLLPLPKVEDHLNPREYQRLSNPRCKTNPRNERIKVKALLMKCLPNRFSFQN